MESQPAKTPVATGAKIPTGHIIVCEKWRGSELARVLKGKLNILYEEDSSVVDFYPSNNVGVVYIAEGDLVAGYAYKRRLAKLRKAQNLRGVAVIEKTRASSQYFQAVQKFAVQDLGLVLLPVENQEQAANLLVQMALVGQRPQSNPFLVKAKGQQQDLAMLATIQTIPKLGDVKAQALLQAFHSIQGVCQASEEELSRVVGKGIANQIKKFLCQPP